MSAGVVTVLGGYKIYYNDYLRDLINGNFTELSGKGNNYGEIKSAFNEALQDDSWSSIPFRVYNNTDILNQATSLFPGSVILSGTESTVVNGETLYSYTTGSYGTADFYKIMNRLTSQTLLSKYSDAPGAYILRLAIPIFRSSDINFRSREIKLNNDYLEEKMWFNFRYRRSDFSWWLGITGETVQHLYNNAPDLVSTSESKTQYIPVRWAFGGKMFEDGFNITVQL